MLALLRDGVDRREPGFFISASAEPASAVN
jgi:hypothetical protein